MPYSSYERCIQFKIYIPSVSTVPTTLLTTASARSQKLPLQLTVPTKFLPENFGIWLLDILQREARAYNCLSTLSIR
jgi:hypothetical protein